MQIWWDMIIWSFMKSTCSSLYLLFLSPLSISYSQSEKHWAEKQNKEKISFNFPNHSFELQNFVSKKLRKYKIHDAVKENLLFMYTEKCPQNK